MTEWSGDRVRQTFVDFFVKKQHDHIPSSAVVPLSDPTLLFANSGMNQFKSIFLGNVDPKSDLGKLKRACNSQKCIRAGGKHNDLDDVGKDTYHHTFFEMLGNWSFGDYFKAEAINWAWELLTEVYKLDKSRLYVTYFQGDEKLKLPADLEAKELWKKHLPEERILPFDMKANFWEMGDVGPCGPCSEIHFDRIGGRDASKLVNMDDPDVIEIWNLVFMQFNREADGSLTTLPKKHIDTGMGLERVTSILQNVRSNYDTDFFTPLFKAIQNATNPSHGYTGKLGDEDEGHVDTAYRVVADHLRTLCHAAADGAEPGSFGRNYVLRRIVRRALRYGTEKLGANDKFFHQLVDALVEQRGHAFPELKQHQERIKQLLRKEEDLWTDTYSKGKAKLKLIVESNKGGPVTAEQIFRLKTTYGFPVDLVLRMLEEDYKLNVSKEIQKEVEVLIEKFKEESGVQAEAKTDLKLNVHSIEELKRKNVPLTVDLFKYQPEIDIEASVLAVWDGKNLKESGKEGKFAVLLDKTNFYAQQGGQIYDTGYLTVVGTDVSFYIDEVYVCGGYIVHVGVSTGEISVGKQVKLTVNVERRRPVMNNHTTTHMLNFALRGVIGETNQKGSDVLPDRFRFDFSHSSSLEVDQLEKVEKIVLDVIKNNHTVYTAEAPLSEARKITSLRQIPGEEYPNPVRIVSIGVPVEKLLAQPDNAEWMKYSIEFCGGSHIKSSAEAETFTIIAEEPLSSGVRRIVAFTGAEAKSAQETAKGLEDKVSGLFNLSSQQKALEVPKIISELEKAVIPAARKISLWKKIQKLQDELKEVGKSAKADQAEKAINFAKETVANLSKEPKPVFVGSLDVGSNNVALTEAAKQIQQGAAETSVLLVSGDTSKDTVTIVSKVPPSAVQKGLKANEWVQFAASKCGGKGGGKPDTAQGSGKGAGNVKAVTDAASEYASSKLGL